MIRTIEEIRRLKMEGKRKWGKDLLEYLKPYFDAGRTYGEIIIILSSEYNIDLDLNELKNLKFRYRKNHETPEHKTFKTSEPQGNYVSKEPEKFEQNQDVSKTELENLYNDLMGDEDIVEKQKRENEELFLRNSKGPKWW